MTWLGGLVQGWSRQKRVLKGCEGAQRVAEGRTRRPGDGVRVCLPQVHASNDCYLLAFSNATDALAFGLTAQSRLVIQDWPHLLANYPQARNKNNPENHSPIWKGLRVAMALHVGNGMLASVDGATGNIQYEGPVRDQLWAMARMVQVCLCLHPAPCRLLPAF